MSNTLNDVVATSVALVSAEKAVSDSLLKLRTFFPTLDDEALKTMVKALASTATVVPTQSIVEVPVSNDAPAPLVGGVDGKRTRPRQLMVIKTDGKEISMSDAILSALGTSKMRVPEICDVFRKRGWKTNSHAGMKFEMSVYTTLNSKKDLFTKFTDPTNKHNTTYEAVTPKIPRGRKPKVVDVPVETPVETKKPVVVKVAGKAPSADKLLEVITEKFVGKKFALREVASELGVEARTISVNMRKLLTDNKVKKIGDVKVDDTGPAIAFYELSP